jgi:hypothetical protein
MAKQQPGKPQPGKASAGKAAGGKGKSPKPGGAAGYVMGWLGRQVGHVKKAVKTDATQAKRGTSAKSGAAPRPAPPQAAPVPEPDASDDAGSTEKIIYREDKIEEAELPDRPGVFLRRTIIDEVVVETEEAADKGQGSEGKRS